MGWDSPLVQRKVGHWPIDSTSDDGEVRAVEQAMVVGTRLTVGNRRQVVSWLCF